MAFSRITVFLLQDVVDPSDAIDAEKTVVAVKTAKGAGVKGTLFYQRSSAHRPGWAVDIQTVLAKPISGVVSASASGVLVLKAKGRWFAVSFGYGRSLINPRSIVRQFGLRVALNVVDPTQLRSMDTKTFEDLVVSKSTQSSKSSDMPAFGVDISRDILRGVAGVPQGKSIASRVHGADAITLVAKLEPYELRDKCKELLREYQRDRYKENFAWIDHLAVVDDPSVRAALDDAMIADLRAGDTASTYMAAPETLEWDDIEHFTIAPTRNRTYEDLDLDLYLSALSSEVRSALTVKNLQQRGVNVKYAKSGNVDRLWTVYQCLISERRLDGRLYVLIEGRWLAVDETLAQQVDTYLKGLPTATTLTPGKQGEKEPAYNRRMANEQPNNLLYLDTKIVRPGGASSGIEFCDLLAKDGTLIHVKRKSRSATLSHLFAQGSVSARALVSDGEFRDKVRAAITERAGAANAAPWLALVPGSSGTVDARSLKVSYVVLARSAADGSDWMPFFSKLNLMQHGKLLQTMSYGVSVSRVDI